MEGWPQLTEAAASLLPSEVTVRVRAIHEVSPSEVPDAWEDWSCGFAPPRRLQFLNGRLAALECLKFLGGDPDPAMLGIGPHREPQWPPGFCGSITHTRAWVLAAVARCGEVASIGVDLEETGRLSRRSWKLVLTPEEQGWLTSGVADSRRDAMATLLFSLKEAFYKWQFPLFGRWMGFQEASINPLPERQSGEAVLTVLGAPVDHGLGGRSFPLRYAFGPNWVLAACSARFPCHE